MCVSPLFSTPFKNSNGNISYLPRYSILSPMFHDVSLNGGLIDTQTGEFYPNKLLPCGNCFECRLDYSREWANRLVLESLDHDYDTCFFVTLTYDDDHLPRFEFDDDKLFNLCNCLKSSKLDQYHEDHINMLIDNQHSTLKYSDFQSFLKRLRSSLKYYGYPSDFRYYVSGEYGEKYRRAHYHAIFFNLHLPDLVLYGRNFNGDGLYTSSFLEECWSNGFVCISNVSWNTMSYTARYVMKKAKGEVSRNIYDSIGLERESCRMSLKPAIAHSWFLDHSSKIYDDGISTISLPNGRSCSPPKIFDFWYARGDGSLVDDDIRLCRLSDMKEKRSYLARLKQERIASNTDLNLSDYYKLKSRCSSVVEKKLSKYLLDT